MITSEQYHRIKLLPNLIIIGIFLHIIQFSHPAFSQESTDDIFNKKVTLAKQRTTVYQALNQLSDSIGYLFAYDSKLVDSDSKIRLTITNLPLRNVLNQILGDTTLTFKVIDQHILIQQNLAQTSQGKGMQASDTTRFFTLIGRILDSKTRKPLPYVTVGIPELALGSITNQEGEFMLRVDKGVKVKNLTISHIGYKKRDVPINLLRIDHFDIFIETDFISIQEVIIRNIDPKMLVRESFAKISENYSPHPTYHTAFYREGVEKNEKIQNYSEAIFKIYKSAYSKTMETDQVKLLKSRKSSNVNPTDTLSIKLRGGVNSSLTLDIAKNVPFYLQENFEEFYTFTRKDIVTFGERLAYVIAFDQKEFSIEPLMVGILYIDVENLAILGADLQINPRNISRSTDQFVYKWNRRFRFKPESIKYTVRYLNLNGVHHLSHVRGDLNFKYRYRRSIFQNSFHLFFELATTQIDTINVSRFSRSETEPTHSVFFENFFEYDQAFWNDFNIIPAEKSVLEALKDINLKVEEIQQDHSER